VNVTLARKEITSANCLLVEAGTNCPAGGDSGHGGRTYFSLADTAATVWQVRVLDRDKKTILFDQPATIEIILGGDTEASTFTEALKFAAQALEQMMHVNGLSDHRNIDLA
jgi:hypothetical protein